MFRRWITTICALIGLLSLIPQAAQAQTPRRWLADPQLIGPIKSIGPTNGLETSTVAFDMKLLSATDGWAATYHGLYRFDGRYWRRDTGAPASIGTLSGPATTLTSLDFSSPSNGWLVGSAYNGSSPPSIEMRRWDGTRWSVANEIVAKDGSTGLMYGQLNDVSLGADGSGLATGIAYIVKDGFSTGQRPLLLRLDGTIWRDVTPDAWPASYSLTSLAVQSATDARISLTRIPTAEAPARAIILHLVNGVWTEETLPDLPPTSQPFSISGLTMVNASEGWAIWTDAGTRCASSALLHLVNGVWQRLPGENHNYQAIRAFGLIPGTNRGWATLAGCDRSGSRAPQRMRFDNGTFTRDSAGASLAPTIYALLNDEVQLGASNGAFMRFSAERLPTERRGAGEEADTLYFVETGHYIDDLFLNYYLTHGLELGDRGVSSREALALFGYPVSEGFEEINPSTGEVLHVQYFERARFEYHPANPEPYKVLLGRLGASSFVMRNGGLSRPGADVPPAPAECNRYIETGYDLCPPFKQFWERNGALPVYGFPITNARDEQSLTDGQTYQTQWLERERLEYHPENRGTPYEILLGLLGSEDLRMRGYLP